MGMTTCEVADSVQADNYQREEQRDDCFNRLQSSHHVFTNYPRTKATEPPRIRLMRRIGLWTPTNFGGSTNTSTALMELLSPTQSSRHSGNSVVCWRSAP